jgi:protein-L-isoaspartate(D-aspartate) O-methyltransferase
VVLSHPAPTDPVVILGKRGVHDLAVRRAMLEVDRAALTTPENAAAASEDRPIADGEDHSLIAPGALAVLLEALSVVPGSKMLVLGAGSGYVPAVAARLAARVDAIEQAVFKRYKPKMCAVALVARQKKVAAT